MNAAIQDTLFQLFEHVRHDPEMLPVVPLDSWPEGSTERHLLESFRGMLEQVQQRILHLRHTEQDLREREEQLREREAQYRAIFEASSDGLTIGDLEDGHVVEVNPAACRMYGYTYEEMIGIHPTATIHPDSFHHVAEALKAIKEIGYYQARLIAVRKDGTTFPLDGHGTPFIYKGKPHILGVARDITKQVQAEQELREREEQYRGVFEASSDAMTISGLEDGVIVEVNPAMCRMFGYTREELIGVLPSVIVHPNSLFVVPEGLHTIQTGGQFHAQLVAVRKDGTSFPVEAYATPFTYKGKPHSLSVARDISERVEAEKQLREKEEQYRSIFEATTDGLFINDLEDGRLVEVNPAACKMHGYSYEELLALHPLAFIHPNSHHLFAEYLQTVKVGEQFHARAMDIRKDGTAFPVEVYGTPFTYKGRPHLLGVVRDITEQMQAEQELREKEEQYRGIFEATTDAMFIADWDGIIIEVNPAACKMYGYSHEEFIGLPPTAIVHPDFLPVVVEATQTIQAGGKVQARVVTVRKDGTTFPTEVHGTMLMYNGKPHSLGIARDITEQVQAQQLLEQRVEERTRELSLLLEISHTVASTLELKPLLGLILDQLKTVVDHTGASILTVEKEDLVYLYNRSPVPREHLAHIRFSFKRGEPVWEAVNMRSPLIVSDLRDETPLSQSLRASMGELSETIFHYVRGLLLVPLVLKEQAIGMLALNSLNVGAFTQHHATLALAIANQAAIAIENARLYEQARTLAAVEERQKLARELHDSVSQALYGISLGAHTARTALDHDPSQLAEPLDYVLSLAEAALSEMRALIFELRPESLETEGLVSALTKQAAALHARHHLEVSTELCTEPDLPLKVKQDLYRIAQEALHNTVKHARASKVKLHLVQTAQGNVLEIHDDGVGFDTTASFPGHLGLHTMRERVTNMGGIFEMESTLGAGTRICVRIPGSV